MQDPLNKKMLYAFGTSIVEGHAAHESFVDDIARAHHMIYHKYAINGATMRVVPNEDPVINIVHQVTQAPKIVPDLIVFDGIANDAYASVTDDPKILGSISTGFADELDTATYCGAFETVCRTLLTKYQGAHPLYITTHKTPARTLATQEKLHDVSLAICRKWSIPVVDLYTQSGFNAFIPAYQHDYSYDKLDADGHNLNAVGGTGTHPNADGYRLFYEPRITAALAAMC
ncbi:SGNH/GDSL hydrolase family protein [Lacticaseibacillus casei]|nr:SGNH/GDSL hydrolase family protein [Lacticaseibacillus casei]